MFARRIKRKQASFVCKEVRGWGKNIHKIAEDKKALASKNGADVSSIGSGISSLIKGNERNDRWGQSLIDVHSGD